MMGDHVTFPKGRRAAMKQQPSEVSRSYFPSASQPSPTSSSSSPLSSSPNSDSEDSLITPMTRASPMIGMNYPIPPLERQYSAPTEELDVARQLAKKPLPRSLHSSLQRAAVSARKPLVEDGETRARKLAAAKKELLALAGQI